MKAQQQAKELVKRFSKHANGYVGSSMLTNTEIPESKFNHSKQIAKEVVAEILKVLEDHNAHFNWQTEKYWKEVLIEIDDLELETCELCDKEDFLTEMRMDEEGCWFCKECVSEAQSKS